MSGFWCLVGGVTFMFGFLFPPLWFFTVIAFFNFIGTSNAPPRV
jgi:hypothetical protein